VSYQHPWGGISGSVTTGYSFHQTGFNATGSVVGHSGGVILGPTVGDTFAIVEIPSGEGVEIRGAGRARVNSRGFGLVPSLSAFNLNDVELNLSNAPLDLDIENISQKIAPLDGSIVRLKFAANAGKATLIQISRDSGDNVPIGAAVQDEDDQILGSVGQGSRALVRLRKDLGRLKVIWGDAPNERCEFNYNISAKTPVNKSGFITLRTACDKTGLAQAISVAQE
jgi:outer membrane usher protein